ncbi:hypothetical protein H6P81_007204 [Aristolochia fimbriata]|uniref:Aminotransferase-like plant mobile domain-containing protein n=1 Tax=Aristolochia fimbriata TaxID=158543 RepID=A0AAV7F1Q1_ARIFI|nr:hypothetical protein H6P81_007204 [Aristolochia fimbriata]
MMLLSIDDLASVQVAEELRMWAPPSCTSSFLSGGNTNPLPANFGKLTLKVRSLYSDCTLRVWSANWRLPAKFGIQYLAVNLGLRDSRRLGNLRIVIWENLGDWETGNWRLPATTTQRTSSVECSAFVWAHSAWSPSAVNFFWLHPAWSPDAKVCSTNRRGSMSATPTSFSFLGLTISAVKIVEEHRPLTLVLGGPSAYGGCDVTAPIVKVVHDLWSRPVVDEDDQICYLPGVDVALSSPHQAVGHIFLSPMHDQLIRFSPPNLSIDSDRFDSWDSHPVVSSAPRHPPNLSRAVDSGKPHSSSVSFYVYILVLQQRPPFFSGGDMQPSKNPWADRGKATGSLGRDRSAVQDRPLSELGVSDALADEVYLAALLSVWLCRFVFPMSGGVLRLSVFKMACFMASGKKCSLAAQPWLTFIGDATLHQGGGVRCWYASEVLPLGPILDKPGHFASRIEVEYFRCLRAAFLVLQQRDNLIVEPYSPHRFAHQFGFCQDLSGVLFTDQWKADTVNALVEVWRSATACPLGCVEVPAFVSPASNPGVTSLYRESWLEAIVPLFEASCTTYGPSHFGANLPPILLVKSIGHRTASTRSPFWNDLSHTFLLKARVIRDW